MSSQGTKLDVVGRDPIGGSRAVRRLRRSGRVPGVLYGGEGGAVPIDMDARELRLALATRGAVLELQLGGEATSAVLQHRQRHPVRGETMHVDLLRVDLNVRIHATVALELVGGDDSPGAKEGGVLEQITREVNVEALPGDIPEAITHDVSGMQINDTLLLGALSAPPNVTLLDDLEETVVANLSPPNVDADAEDDAIEQETAVVGEDGEAAGSDGDAPAEAADEDAS